MKSTKRIVPCASDCNQYLSSSACFPVSFSPESVSHSCVISPQLRQNDRQPRQERHRSTDDSVIVRTAGRRQAVPGRPSTAAGHRGRDGAAHGRAGRARILTSQPCATGECAPVTSAGVTRTHGMTSAAPAATCRPPEAPGGSTQSAASGPVRPARTAVQRRGASGYIRIPTAGSSRDHERRSNVSLG